MKMSCIVSGWRKSKALCPHLLKKTVLTKPSSLPTVQSSVHTPVSGETSLTGSRPATVMDFSHIIPPGTGKVGTFPCLAAADNCSNTKIDPISDTERD